ncbi:hypothetical protein DUI87_05876 [Hirundo rustica rustica]|uniref:Uncharacterized protein n=1 Tax=Hirundo rustica rustica TaxID=333673 RepID=A0A3M0KVW7_HIRRU|nr:hypothetical protein DUI87_05876 [Hirundo rustica rustica]
MCQNKIRHISNKVLFTIITECALEMKGYFRVSAELKSRVTEIESRPNSSKNEMRPFHLELKVAKKANDILVSISKSVASRIKAGIDPCTRHWHEKLLSVPPTSPKARSFQTETFNTQASDLRYPLKNMSEGIKPIRYKLLLFLRQPMVGSFMDIPALEDMLMDLLGLGVPSPHEGSFWRQLNATGSGRTEDAPMAPQGQSSSSTSDTCPQPWVLGQGHDDAQ